MNGALTIALSVVAGLFVLWALGVGVYLIGAKMRPFIDAHEKIDDRAAIWGWGALYSVAAPVLLFLLVRFAKFAWTFQ